MLHLDAITMRLGGHLILDAATASLPDRARVGLVGRNGAGKSTLMKIIAGEAEADAGTIAMTRGARVGYLAQDAPGGSASPFDTVLAADTERTGLLAEAESTDDGHRIGEIHDRLNLIDAHGAPARAARILAGLGFDEDAQHRALDTFSGGWRMRVALAALLFSAPDLLLLDEPSNHLDLEAEIWLETFLKSYRASLIVVSHERDLLNNVVDYILHLEGGKMTLFPGGYDDFERLRRERQAQVEAQRARLESKRKSLRDYVDRWRYKAHTARQAQSRLKALARMEPIAEATEDASLVFQFPSPAEMRPPLMLLEGAAVGYEADTPVLSRLDLRIDPDDRIGLMGRNGNGKTTLARLLARDLEPMAGAVSASGKLKVGHFAQHQIENLVSEETPLQHMARVLPEAGAGELRGQLGRFGFSGDKAEVEVRRLSGGERARLALALITREAPQLLILDEPTNHLDVDAREALVQALGAYNGAVVVVSHDRHMLELTVDRLVLVAEGTVREFDGDLNDYRDLVLGRGQNGGDTPVKPAKRANKREQRRAAAQARARNRAFYEAVEKADAELARLTGRRDDIDRALADPAAASGDLKSMSAGELMKLRGQIDREIATAEENWIEASEALEQVKAEIDAAGQ